MTSGLAGPAVEQEIVNDMLRRSLPAIPVVLVLAALPWGLAGAISAGYAIALVAVNFILSAALLSWSARISLSLMMASALFGFVLRLGLITIAVLAVKDFGWVRLVPLGLTIVVTHLGLLLWEMRYVSASIAFPGLRPRAHSEVAA